MSVEMQRLLQALLDVKAKPVEIYRKSSPDDYRAALIHEEQDCVAPLALLEHTATSAEIEGS